MGIGKPYINQELLDKVLKAKEGELLHDDSFKIWERGLNINEKRYLSDLGRKVENFSKEEIAVVVLIAVQNFPEMVFQILMEEYLDNKRKGEKSNENDKYV